MLEKEGEYTDLRRMSGGPSIKESQDCYYGILLEHCYRTAFSLRVCLAPVLRVEEGPKDQANWHPRHAARPRHLGG